MDRLLSCAIVFEPLSAIAYLEGELDLWTAECVANRLTPLVWAGCNVVVNLSGLCFVGTAGLDLLDRLGRCAASRGGSLCLEDPSPSVRHLLNVTDSEHRFTFRVSKTEA